MFGEIDLTWSGLSAFATATIAQTSRQILTLLGQYSQSPSSLSSSITQSPRATISGSGGFFKFAGLLGGNFYNILVTLVADYNSIAGTGFDSSITPITIKIDTPSDSLSVHSYQQPSRTIHQHQIIQLILFLLHIPTNGPT